MSPLGVYDEAGAYDQRVAEAKQALGFAFLSGTDQELNEAKFQLKAAYTATSRVIINSRDANVVDIGAVLLAGVDEKRLGLFADHRARLTCGGIDLDDPEGLVAALVAGATAESATTPEIAAVLLRRRAADTRGVAVRALGLVPRVPPRRRAPVA